jgi:aldehyde dehydrogenase (NAD+)/betaine-aldehyde dehydrogenase
MIEIRNSTYIADRWEAGEGSQPLTPVNPATAAHDFKISASSVGQVDRAVAAARHAFRSPAWQDYGPAERSQVLSDLADVLEKNATELASMVVDEVGTPISLARGMQLPGPIEVFRWYAEAALQGPRGSYEQELPEYDNPVPSRSLLVQEPVGVVGAMTAYNYPINLIAWKLGGALASGCTTVLLPSPRASATTIRVFELIAGLGLPPGVVNLVVGGPDIGRALAGHPGLDLLTFTGSDSVGAKVMAQASPHITRTVLELGGKAANIILPGANLETGVPQAVGRFCRNAGQGCGAWTRMLVPRSMMSDFLAAIKRYLDEDVVVGDPRDERTMVGPLISAEHRDFVEREVAAAVDRGARVVAGGGRPSRGQHGYFINPVLLADLAADDPICDTELFAPVAIVLPYESVNEAISIANNSWFGLNANITGDAQQAMEIARRLRVGTVTINNGSGMRPDAPWGGYKRSGIGRELGEDGFAEFFETKHIQWAI